MNQPTISNVRSRLLLNSPFFGYLVLQLKYIEDTSLYYMATDGEHLWYNPTKIRHEEIQASIGVLIHEIAHCILDHPGRGVGKDYNTWANAIDYAVNGFLHAYTDFVLPTPHLYDPKYVNWTADDIYDDLLKSKDKDELAEGEKISRLCGIVLDPGDEPGDSDYEGDTGDPQAPGGDQKQNKPPIPKPVLQKLSDKWKRAMEGALIVGKEAGDGTGDLQVFIKKLLEPVLPWGDILREFLQSTAKQGFDWNQPNRRFQRQGLYLPKRKSQTIGTVYVGVDTSCSVTDEEFEWIQSESNSILEDAGASKIVLIHCDTKIKNVEEFTPEDLPIYLDFKGRGGTAFKPVFDYLAENAEEDIVALIYFTDLEGDTSFDPPEYPTIWIDTNKPGYQVKQPKFGSVIKINP